MKKIDGKHVSLLAPIPGGRGHNSRTVAVGPDKRVYVSLGISGNCSNEYLGADYPFDRGRGGVMVLNEQGGKVGWQTFSSGLRDPVGFAWHPETEVMYASNNGPDHWGYELPPEYFSRIDKGSFHGMPWFQFDGFKVRRDNCVENLVTGFQLRNGKRWARPVGLAIGPDGALYFTSDDGVEGLFRLRPEKQVPLVTGDDVP